MILKKTFKWFTAVILKGTNWRHGIGSTVAGVWHCLNVEEAKAGLVVANLVKQCGGWRRGDCCWCVGW